MHRDSRRLVVLAVAAGVVLAACSSPDRMAAPADEVAVAAVDESEANEPDAADDSLDPASSLFTKSTRVCVRNAATRSDDAVKVQFTKADTSDSGWLVPNGAKKERCGEGGWERGWDVIGTLEFPYFTTYSSGEYEFLADNPKLGYPEMPFNQTSPVQTRCVMPAAFSEGEQRLVRDGMYDFTIERLPDTKWKEFRITIRNTTKPSDDGKVRACE